MKQVLIKSTAFLISLLLLNGCAEIPGGPEQIILSPVSFSELPGWGNDHVSAALPALQRSCSKLHKSANWTELCDELDNLPQHDDAAAFAFFENNFEAFSAASTVKETGLFTGYYEAELRGSLQQTDTYQYPLYARPSDLIDVDLGDFKKDLAGQHIVGKVKDHHLKPYDGRAEIAEGSLKDRAQILAYVDDPVDAFFLAVQGSGIVTLNDGSILRVGYDGANGKAYVAIGRAMADQGLIEKPVTMLKIREWLKAHPDRADAMMNLNPSYVFFRKIEGDGPIGAQSVALTAQRSLAVDPVFVKLGTPVWLDTQDGFGAPLQRLVIAQDTGGAIKGAVRGDFFWGAGTDAANEAGAMQSAGHYYLLLPKKGTVHVSQ